MNVRAPVGQYSRIFFLITKQFGDNNANMDYLVISEKKGFPLQNR